MVSTSIIIEDNRVRIESSRLKNEQVAFELSHRLNQLEMVVQGSIDRAQGKAEVTLKKKKDAIYALIGRLDYLEPLSLEYWPSTKQAASLKHRLQARRKKHFRKLVNWSMIVSVSVSLITAIERKRRLHRQSSYVFLGFAAIHAWLNRQRLL